LCTTWLRLFLHEPNKNCDQSLNNLNYVADLLLSPVSIISITCIKSVGMYALSINLLIFVKVGLVDLVILHIIILLKRSIMGWIIAKVDILRTLCDVYLLETSNYWCCQAIMRTTIFGECHMFPTQWRYQKLQPLHNVSLLTSFPYFSRIPIYHINVSLVPSF
jgi:hypothetical protein